jgi:hypothetical protein
MAVIDFLAPFDGMTRIRFKGSVQFRPDTLSQLAPPHCDRA